MKKIITSVSLLLAFFLISGCGGTKVNKTCSLTSTDLEKGYKLDTTYEIFGNDDVVDKVILTEVITSDDDQVLSYFEETLNKTYDDANENYGGYKNSITNDNNKLVSKTEIDYNKIDIDKYLDDHIDIKDCVNSDNKISIAGLLTVYNSLGATCK